ncbi:MAG: hypothetical protein AAF639_35360 [Chloroflexota bacterium]
MSHSHKKYQNGVLFVHGLGNHKRGAALTSFGQSLLQCINDCHRNADENGVPLNQWRNVEVDHAAIEVLPDQLGGPPHAAVHMKSSDNQTSNDEDNETNTMLLAESHWDATYPAPTYLDLMTWAVDVLPWTIITHVNKTLRRAEYHFSDSQGASAGERVGAITRWLGAHLLLLVALLMSPFLVFLIISLAVLSSIPIPFLGNIIASIQRGLANTVGDSLVLVGNPLSGAVIYERVRQDIKWLERRCENVIVIAHSQGAAIAHHVVRNNQEKLDVSLLITLGSGLSKLSNIIYRKGANAFGYMWSAITAIFITSVASLVLIFDLTMLTTEFSKSIVNLLNPSLIDWFLVPIWSVLLIVSFTITVIARHFRWSVLKWQFILLSSVGSVVALVATYMLQLTQLEEMCWAIAFFINSMLAHMAMRGWEWENGKQPQANDQEAQDKALFEERFKLNIPWHDYYTRLDLVPNGPLLDRYDPTHDRSNEFQQMEIQNRNAFLGDHFEYWSNMEQFVYPVANALNRIANNGSADNTAPRFADINSLVPPEAIERRQKRVTWLNRGMLALTLVFLMISTLLLIPVFMEANPEGYAGWVPALEEISMRFYSLMNWTLLPAAFNMVLGVMVGEENEMTAMFLGYCLTLFFFFTFSRVMWNILWAIQFERRDRRTFFQEISGS